MTRTRMVALVVGIAVVAGGLVFVARRVAHDGVAWSPESQADRLLTAAQRAAADDMRTNARAHIDELLERFPDSDAARMAQLLIGELQEQDGAPDRAAATYQQIIDAFPETAAATQARAALGRVNIVRIFSRELMPDDILYEVQSGDTLSGIAKRFHTNVELLKRANHLTSDLIRPNQGLKVVGGTFSILVDKSDNWLILKRGDQHVKKYAVATGDHNSTPEGTFEITTRLVDPPWYTAKGVISAGSPENILGTRWLGFNKPSYGIHGTTDPSSIGTQATAGCVRMHNTDVEELFAIVPVGTAVTIVD